MTEWTMIDAMASLDPILDDLDVIARGGLAKYRQYPPELLVDHDARAAASCIYCHMVADAEARLSDRADVVPKNVRGLKVWIVGQVAVIRFKKMDEDGRSRNYPTKQARAYDKQAQLPGLPSPPLNLVVGYLPDPTETEVLRVQVARPLGKGIDWCTALVPATELEVGSLVGSTCLVRRVRESNGADIMAAFNHHMLTLARESRGLTQSELAALVPFGQGTLSKYETGFLAPSDEAVSDLASALGYPPAFFSQIGRPFGFPPFHYRKRKKLSKKALGKIVAEMNIRRMHVEKLTVSYESKSNRFIPEIDLDEFQGRWIP